MGLGTKEKSDKRSFNHSASEKITHIDSPPYRSCFIVPWIISLDSNSLGNAKFIFDHLHHT